MEILHARDPAAVAALARRIVGADQLAFDTEFLWERTYYPRLCLVQLATDDVLATVDPLVVDDLGPVWEALVGGPTVIVHAGAHDLDIVHRAVGRLPERVVDTQVAASFLGYGDTPGHGTLVGKALGVRVRGGEGYTDWARRPLTDEQVDYALDDVRHLIDLWSRLHADLEERGRTAWAEEETRVRFSGIGEPVEPRQQWRRVKDARRLSGRALAVLQETAAWREDTAMEHDETRQRVVPDRVLIEVARRASTDPARIAKMRGLHPGQAKRVAGPLAQAVRAALETPKDRWPRWPSAPAFAGDPRVDSIASVLHAVVRARAIDLDLASRLLGTRSDLEDLARRRLSGDLDEPDGATLLTGWRRKAIGEELLSVLRGEAALRIAEGDDGPRLQVG